MLDRERLLRISELDGAGINRLSDSELDALTTTVNAFIDGFPVQEEGVKNALKNKDLGALGKSLAVVNTVLRSIYAEKLAGTCEYTLASIADVQYDDLEAFVVEFLKAVSALSIDLQMADYKEGSADEPSEGAPQQSKPGNAILAVDDRHFFLTAIKTMLQGTGYKVTCINTGAAALNYLKNHRPDLFILDIEMPEMDGYELAGKIKEAGHKAPVIFLTGNARKDYVVKAMQSGAVDFIIKPVTKDQLLERIGKHLAPELPEEQS